MRASRYLGLLVALVAGVAAPSHGRADCLATKVTYGTCATGCEYYDDCWGVSIDCCDGQTRPVCPGAQGCVYCEDSPGSPCQKPPNPPSACDAPEVCDNGTDENFNGCVGEGCPKGEGECTCTAQCGGATNCFSPQQATCDPYKPGVAEVCGDGLDNNCDRNVDENCPAARLTSATAPTTSTARRSLSEEDRIRSDPACITRSVDDPLRGFQRAGGIRPRGHPHLQ